MMTLRTRDGNEKGKRTSKKKIRGIMKNNTNALNDVLKFCNAVLHRRQRIVWLAEIRADSRCNGFWPAASPQYGKCHHTSRR